MKRLQIVLLLLAGLLAPTANAFETWQASEIFDLVDRAAGAEVDRQAPVLPAEPSAIEQACSAQQKADMRLLTGVWTLVDSKSASPFSKQHTLLIFPNHSYVWKTSMGKTIQGHWLATGDKSFPIALTHAYEAKTWKVGLHSCRPPHIAIRAGHLSFEGQ